MKQPNERNVVVPQSVNVKSDGWLVGAVSSVNGGLFESSSALPLGVELSDDDDGDDAAADDADDATRVRSCRR